MGSVSDGVYEIGVVAHHPYDLLMEAGLYFCGGRFSIRTRLAEDSFRSAADKPSL
jgi:hypothetical protein